MSPHAGLAVDLWPPPTVGAAPLGGRLAHPWLRRRRRLLATPPLLPPPPLADLVAFSPVVGAAPPKLALVRPWSWPPRLIVPSMKLPPPGIGPNPSFHTPSSRSTLSALPHSCIIVWLAC
nr:unnamed protein product [Digitaria exilis]